MPTPIPSNIIQRQTNNNFQTLDQRHSDSIGVPGSAQAKAEDYAVSVLNKMNKLDINGMTVNDVVEQQFSFLEEEMQFGSDTKLVPPSYRTFFLPQGAIENRLASSDPGFKPYNDCYTEVINGYLLSFMLKELCKLNGNENIYEEVCNLRKHNFEYSREDAIWVMPGILSTIENLENSSRKEDFLKAHVHLKILPTVTIFAITVITANYFYKKNQISPETQQASNPFRELTVTEVAVGLSSILFIYLLALRELSVTRCVLAMSENFRAGLRNSKESQSAAQEEIKKLCDLIKVEDSSESSNKIIKQTLIVRSHFNDLFVELAKPKISLA